MNNHEHVKFYRQVMALTHYLPLFQCNNDFFPNRGQCVSIMYQSVSQLGDGNALNNIHRFFIFLVLSHFKDLWEIFHIKSCFVKYSASHVEKTTSPSNKLKLCYVFKSGTLQGVDSFYRTAGQTLLRAQT